MFPGGDMNDLLAAAAQMQSQLAQAQDRLAATHVSGSAGGGLVSATVTGAGEVVGLQIDPSVCDTADTETLADLVLAAIRDATRAAAALQADVMGPLGDSLGGLGLGGPPDAPGAGPALGPAG